MRLSEDAILTNDYRKAELSFAYLSAICAMAGYTCERGPSVDMDSIDASVRSGGVPRILIDVQLKSTSSPDLIGGNLHFRLSQKNYNDLADLRQVPIILAVLELPASQDEWLRCDADNLVLRRRLWWTSLRGEQPISAGSKTVIIPQSQLLTPDSLRELAANERELMLEPRSP